MTRPLFRAGKANSLILMGLGAAIVLIGLWLVTRHRGGSEEIDRTVKTDKDSSAAWQARIDSITEASRARDSVAAEDSIAAEKFRLRSLALTKSLQETRLQLVNLATVEDSLRIYTRLDTLHENRHTADAERILVLQRQADVFRLDRDDWKRAATKLQLENVRITQDLIRVGEIAKQSCDLLIVHVPCPQLVLGAGGQLAPSGHVSAGLQLTAGIPIRLGKKKAPAAQLLQPQSASPSSSLPVVSDLELRTAP